MASISVGQICSNISTSTRKLCVIFNQLSFIFPVMPQNTFIHCAIIPSQFGNFCVKRHCPPKTDLSPPNQYLCEHICHICRLSWLTYMYLTPYFTESGIICVLFSITCHKTSHISPSTRSNAFNINEVANISVQCTWSYFKYFSWHLPSITFQPRYKTLRNAFISWTYFTLFWNEAQNFNM